MHAYLFHGTAYASESFINDPFDLYVCMCVCVYMPPGASLTIRSIYMCACVCMYACMHMPPIVPARSPRPVCTCVCVFMYVCMYSCIPSRSPRPMYDCACFCPYIPIIYIHTHIYMQVCAHMHTYALCMYACMHVCACMHVYIEKSREVEKLSQGGHAHTHTHTCVCVCVFVYTCTHGTLVLFFCRIFLLSCTHTRARVQDNSYTCIIHLEHSV